MSTYHIVGNHMSRLIYLTFSNTLVYFVKVALLCGLKLIFKTYSVKFFCRTSIIQIHYTIIDFNEVDIRIYLPEKVIIHRGR